MKLSVSETKSKFRPLNIDGFRGLESVMKRYTYSCGVFKDNHRLSKNFIYADTIALDFDKGSTLEIAMKRFSKYKHIIAPTKSHDEFGQHRFRVILFLTEPITDAKIYEATIRDLLKIYPEADKACKDAGRMYYASKSIYSTNENGLTIPAAMIDDPPSSLSESDDLDFSRKPAGWSNCMWSIASGNIPGNTGNEYLLALTSNLKKLNYTKTQAYHICLDAYQKRGKDYDKKILWRTIIEYVYGDNWEGAKYVCTKEGTKLHDYCLSLGVHSCPKKKSSAFNFQKIGELMSSNTKIEYLVEGLLSKGGISIIAGPPKSGKSTLIRQLTKSVVKGENFLGRSTKKGSIAYLALEEQPELLKEQFYKVGISNADDIIIHTGGVLSGTCFEDLSEMLHDKKPALLVIDTLMLLANIKDANNYIEMNTVLANYRGLARSTGTHIICVHHQNKPAMGMSTANRGANSILGSAAIHGAMDCAMIFNVERSKRFINTSQRGGTPFRHQELEFDYATESYKLKSKDKNHDEF